MSELLDDVEDMKMCYDNITQLLSFQCGSFPCESCYYKMDGSCLKVKARELFNVDGDYNHVISSIKDLFELMDSIYATVEETCYVDGSHCHDGSCPFQKLETNCRRIKLREKFEQHIKNTGEHP